MAQPKKKQATSDHLEEAGRRMASYRRAAAAFEHEAVHRAVRTLGRPDLLDELGRPLSAASVNEHRLLREYYPLHLDVRFTGKSNPPPVPWSTPLPPLKKMVFEFPDTAFYQVCIRPKVYELSDEDRGCAVVFPYGGTSLILHNRPDLAEGPPLVSVELKNGCRVEIHWFQPFADDVAGSCRYRLAEDGSELMDRIESNCPFREAFWEDYADRFPPVEE